METFKRILLDMICCAAEEAWDEGLLTEEQRRCIFRIWEHQAGMEPNEHTNWVRA